jgi:hypothetical protein
MVRASGWRDGMNAMFFITIVREFTAVSLVEAKAYLDRLRDGEQLDLHPYQAGQSVAFAEKLLRFSVVERAEVADAEPGAAADGGA